MKIYQFADAEWWLAHSADEAYKTALAFYEFQDGDLDAPFEVDDANLDILTYTDQWNQQSTFRQQLALQLGRDAETPRFFASANE